MLAPAGAPEAKPVKREPSDVPRRRPPKSSSKNEEKPPPENWLKSNPSKPEVPPEGDVPVRPDALYVLSHRLHEPGGVRGTYKYRGEWNQLDHLVVSGALLDATSCFHTGADRCRIAVLDFLVHPDRTYGGVAPSRTYLGRYYNGGVSDHLPLFTDFEMLP